MKLYPAIRIAATLGCLCSLMGMDGGCTQSRIPLGSRDDGLIDHYLVGDWYPVDVSDDGLFDTEDRALSFDLSAGGELRVRLAPRFSAGSCPVPECIHEFSAFTTPIGSRNYLNLRRTGCTGCDAATQAKIASDPCPYSIVLYSTFLPKGLLEESGLDPEVGARVVAQAEPLRGKLLVMRLMSDDHAASAIASGQVEGEIDCKGCVGEGTCLAADQSALAAFLREREKELFSNNFLLSREPLVQRDIDGMPIGMSRAGFLDEVGFGSGAILTRSTEKEVVVIRWIGRLGGPHRQIVDFENGRVSGYRYEPLDEAPLFERIAYNLTDGVIMADGRGASLRWQMQTGADAAPREAFLECIDRLSNATDFDLVTDLFAAAVLVQCVRDHGVLAKLEVSDVLELPELTDEWEAQP